MRRSSLLENLGSGFDGSVEEQLRAPSEVVFLAGIQADSLFLFADGGERIAGTFGAIAG